VLFIGSTRSDVHRLCAAGVEAGRYLRAEAGDVAGAFEALELLAQGSAV
jgi:hypothetical protein